MKKRIWELDAFRGLCIIGVVIVHLIFDLVDLYGIIQWQYPQWFFFLKQWGGTVFLLLSGICVTLGSRSIRRGIIVFCAGLVCTAVTWAMTLFGFHNSMIIWFGALHCLGVCMMLWPLVKKLPVWAIGLLGLVLTGAGLAIVDVRVYTFWLIPLGFVFPGFSSSDYYPLLPNLGFFLLGCVLGRTLYAKKESLLPDWSANSLVRMLCLCGRQSLWIYLLHQPVLAGLCYLISGG